MYVCYEHNIPYGHPRAATAAATTTHRYQRTGVQATARIRPDYVLLERRQHCLAIEWFDVWFSAPLIALHTLVRFSQAADFGRPQFADVFALDVVARPEDVVDESQG